MNENFCILSFNYKNMNLEEREEFAKSHYKKVIESYFENGKIKGFVVLKTCLRVEIYLELDKNFKFQKLKDEFVSRSEFLKKAMSIYVGKEAVDYLFRVICGLESIIKGEDQILVQMKKAYFDGLENERTTSLLNVIFNSAIETGKKFRAESKINEKNISLDSIAVKFMKNRVENIENKSIFVIGVGDLSQSILALLHKMGHKNLTMTNRSLRRSIELQKIFDNVKTAEFSDKYTVVKESDIILSATSAPHLILEHEKMDDILSDGKKRFFLDLAVPRDIDAKIGDFDNADLYNLDDIWDEYNKNVEKREKIVEKYRYIIDEQLEKLHKKLENREKFIKNKDFQMEKVNLINV